MKITITPIQAFNDNYIWLIQPDDKHPNVAVVDPGDAEPVIEHCRQHELTLTDILITHHHPDHIGGVVALKQFSPEVAVHAPQHRHVPPLGHIIEGNDQLHLPALDLEFQVIHTPGHTVDHVCYYQADHQLLFCGDTLFAGGCGRLFEGTAEQMLTSLETLMALPANTQCYAAHEYTCANLEFALSIEPKNTALQERLQHCQALRAQNQITLPTQISTELATNPFCRSHLPECQQSASQAMSKPLDTALETFSAIRQAKDCH